MRLELSLLDYITFRMGCQYISDLKFLSKIETLMLAAHIEEIDVQDFSLSEWNSAIRYLTDDNTEKESSTAKKKLVRALRDCSEKQDTATTVKQSGLTAYFIPKEQFTDRKAKSLVKNGSIFRQKH